MRISDWSSDVCSSDLGYRCRLYSFAGGNTYRLFKNLEIRDVRLVYAPPGSVGAFGGDLDNWMWPRHTGDFSFYRAYVRKDGKPDAYSDAHVAFKPEPPLKFPHTPQLAGPFVIVAVYPGRPPRP